MDSITKSDRIKLAILEKLEKKNKLTPSFLASQLNCKYETVLKSLNFFENIGLVKKEIVTHGKKNYALYELTEIGHEVSKHVEAN